MRVPPSLPVPLLAALVAVLALSPAATAQDPDAEPGCAQSNPCEVELGLDSTGIYDLSYDRFGTGDWILFSVFNDDDEEHTVRLEGHSFEFSIGAGDINDTRPLKLGAPGTYDLTDLPSGDSATITVEANEVFDVDDDGSDNDETDGNPIPGLAPSLLVVGLAAAAWVARRK
jgi:hypothetical protein